MSEVAEKNTNPNRDVRLIGGMLDGKFAPIKKFTNAIFKFDYSQPGPENPYGEERWSVYKLHSNGAGYCVKDAEGYIASIPVEDTVVELTFSDALVELKAGKKVSRKGWNGKGMFLFLVAGSQFKVNRAPLLGIYPEGTEINYQPHVDMCTASGSIVPWLCSQSDMLANDWMIVE